MSAAARTDRKTSWLFGLDAASRHRRVEHDDGGSVLALSGIDSMGVTRFRIYVFNKADESMAAQTATELLNQIDPIL